MFPDPKGDPRGGLLPVLEGKQREMLLREQEAVIEAARRTLTIERRTRRKEAEGTPSVAHGERKAKGGPVAKEDPAKRRRVQLQVFIHAR